ncbi:hypothetical protein ACFX13_029998 [Malus domestica]
MVTNPTICVKALVDKGSNKVIFVESGNDLVDTLFSYLTIPMGTVIDLARKHSDPAVIGCMKNLYASVESIGEEEFLGNIFKDMLLHPRSAAEPLYRNLNFKLHNVRPLPYYMCFDSGSCKFLSYESDVQCPHHLFHNEPIMDRDNCPSVGASQDGSDFIKGRLWLTITDDLQVFYSAWSRRRECYGGVHFQYRN